MRASEYSLGIQVQQNQNIQQDQQHEPLNGLRGVLPALPIPLDKMSEAALATLDKLIQEIRAKHVVPEPTPVIAVHLPDATCHPSTALPVEPAEPVHPRVVQTAQANPIDFKAMQARASQENARRVIAEAREALELEIANTLLMGANVEWLQRKYGTELVLRAQERSKNMTLSNPQAFTRYRNTMNEAKRALGKHLAANGGGQQHSVEDYKHVLLTQLELQLQGDNPPANVVLNKAYPDDPKKAMGIGNSQRMSRVKQAYEVEQVKKHPVHVQTAGMYSARELQQRLACSRFRHSLALNHTMFNKASRIASLEARVTELEQQMCSTKCREALDDAGATSSTEKVIALYQSGMTAKPISVALDMPYQTVKSYIGRYKVRVQGANAPHFV